MGAYEELRDTGEMGEFGAALLYQTVADVARVRRFPPPDGHDRWNDDAVMETAHDFLTERSGVARMRQIQLRAFDEESFEKLLHQAVRNHLRSRSRASDLGALIRRVRTVLEEDDRFVTVGTSGILRWTLQSTGVREQFTGQIETLIAASRSVEGVTMVRWRSERRRGPVADREALAQIFEAVLVAAGTSLSAIELAKVTAARFNLLDPPLLLELDEAFWRPDPFAEVGPAERAVAAEQAAEIWEQLSPRERTIYLFVDQSARQAAEHVGLGKSQIAVSQARIKELISDAIGGSPDAPSVIAELERLAGADQNRTLR
jgi:hypothetical protein